MNPDDKMRFAAGETEQGPGAPSGLSEQESLRKDTSYSPASETETAQKQQDPLPDTVDADIDPADVRAVPGTGGPDDTGDVEVDPGDLNMPWSEGLGPDGTVPPDPDGVAAGFTGTPSTFEPEEDEQA